MGDAAGIITRDINGLPDDPIDDLTWDLQCLGLRRVLESVVGEDTLKNIYTVSVLVFAFIIAVIGRSSRNMSTLRRRQFQLRYAVIVLGILAFVAFCFIMVGYGMGYTTGYGERISNEELNAYQFALTSMVMRVFWSFLLSCGIAFMYSYTSQCLPCCPGSC